MKQSEIHNPQQGGRGYEKEKENAEEREEAHTFISRKSIKNKTLQNNFNDYPKRTFLGFVPHKIKVACFYIFTFQECF